MRTSRGEVAAKSDARAARRVGEGKRVSARAAREPVAPTVMVERMASQAVQRDVGATDSVRLGLRNQAVSASGMAARCGAEGEGDEDEVEQGADARCRPVDELDQSGEAGVVGEVIAIAEGPVGAAACARA